MREVTFDGLTLVSITILSPPTSPRCQSLLEADTTTTDAKVQLPSFQQIASSTGATRERRRSSAASKKDRDKDRREANGQQQREKARRQPSTISAGVQASGTEDEPEQEEAQPRARDNWDDDRATLVPALITEDQERELFQLFFDKININAALLDPRLHKYEYVRKRSGFLLTVMTAIASRYVAGTGLSLDVPGKKSIFMDAMARARRAAALALVTAGKSVESCQAYILLTLFDKPTRPGEEDKGWQFSGLAIRMATDLNLHLTGPSHEIEQRVREHINRQRVWLVCFNLDRSLSTQFGRPNTVLLDFPGVREWCYKNGRWNDPYDLTSCAFAEVMIAMTEFQKRVFRDEAGAASSGLALRGEDLKKLTLEYDTRIREICAVWKPRVEGHLPDYPGCSYRTLLWPFCVEYSRLVMFSFGFQEAFQTGAIASTEDFWFRECYNAAKTIVEVCVTSLLRSLVNYKFTFHSHYVYPTFAAAFLLKLLRPAFASFLPLGQKETIVQLVRSAVDVFNAVAVDDGHAPKHYARFLKNHLNK
ncbi:fungal-specific transcription factor domain-containing protein, partial [Auriculariales sp. MPI-PUGE-AT-0066]